MAYNLVDGEFIAALQEITGKEHVFTDREKLEQYKTDEETDESYHRVPEAVVFPGSAAEVAAVMKLANKHLVPVTPRSAGTSLVAGAIATEGGIVMVLSRMDKILEINKDALYMKVQCGARTEDIQKAAKALGLLYAGDPCSADSCLIGGNIATNAGGNRAVKYGATREQVYSIEVVTPEGDITTLGARLSKKTTGYCLEQLIMGSEGTLGIITGAVLKLKPLPVYKMDILAIVTDYLAATRLVQKIINTGGIDPTSMEFMDNKAVRSCSDYIKIPLPHYEDGHYVIITLDGFSEAELEARVAVLDELCTQNGALEVLEADEERIWKARRSMAEAGRAESKVVYYEDVVVPIDKIGEMLERAAYFEQKYNLLNRTVAHAGDGNIHFTLLKGSLTDNEWHKMLDTFHEEIYALAYQMGGRLSGEHGIGAKKIDTMAMYTDPVELALMKKIKKALDPNNILNPGKIFQW